ncbi:MAG: diguanylate cyclase [Desulfamplus sp.]|nr:diguanylate cyclase [Desulfamplus sp.]
MNSSILIVDDDDAIRSTAEEFLELSGYSTISSSSGEEALGLLKYYQPDIVLTDISMHGMSGLELTRTIRTLYPTVEVIVMTGYIADHSYEEAVNAGASDFIFKPFRFEELNLRIKRVLREITLKKQHAEAIKKLEELAVTDGLTGLYNQRYFYQQLKAEIERCLRYKSPLSIILFDIDHFKKFNDTYGHLEGDNVLMAVAKIVGSCLRAMDSAYRYGGEEFTVILPETKLDQACIVGDRIRKSFSQETFNPMPVNGKTPVKESCTISLGVTQFKEEDTVITFVKRADQAMYQSKKSGRNRLTSLPGSSPHIPDPLQMTV